MTGPMDLRTWINLVEQAQRPAVNSLGRPLAMTPEGLTNFWTWFGGSKVRDRNGCPLVLYHGTTADIRAFDPGHSQGKIDPFTKARPAFFFALHPDVAQSYAGQKTLTHAWTADTDFAEYERLLDAGRQDDAMQFLRTRMLANVKTWKAGANLMPVYLRLVRPLRINARGYNWDELPYEDEFISTRELIEIARDKGHDGFIVRNVRDRGEGKGAPTSVYAVFSPSQIKSALSNTGAFGPDDVIDEGRAPSAGGRSDR